MPISFSDFFGRKNDDNEEKEWQQQGATSGTAVLRGHDGELQQHLIKIYLNGFMLNDGEFVPLAPEEREQFIETLKRSQVPPQLMPQMQAQNASPEVAVAVRQIEENYEPPKPQFQAFQGVGMSLTDGASATDLDVGFDSAVPQEYRADPSLPTTTLQLVTHQRQRFRVTFNLSATVLDVYQHLMAVSNFTAPFTMLAGFPPRPLTDPKATLEQVGLRNDTVTQKLR
ncbi:MAG: hypothetical protein MHM6MM_000826 [Cercozoa sp. M6MM]